MKILNPRAEKDHPMLVSIPTPVNSFALIEAVHVCRKRRERLGGRRPRTLLMHPCAAAEILEGAKRKYDREDRLDLMTLPTQMRPGLRLSIETSFSMPPNVVSID